MRKLLLIGFLLLAAGLAANIAWAETEFKIITLQHRFAQDLLPIIQPMVGEGGSASAIDNHLMIRATPERMQAIKQIIATLDIARKNVRIMVSHSDVSQNQRDRVGVSGRVRSGNVEVQIPNGAADGVRLDIERRQSNSNRQGTEFVTVLDGERAFIRFGQSVPYTQQWVSLTQRYLTIQQTTEFRDITTGFAVRPRYIGDQVELEITPRITGLNHAGFIDFEELSTVVRVTPGQWFDLGGNMQSRDDVSRAILSRQNGSGGRNTGLTIKID
jgi:type II secretory pathway component GspD/PulD (secretin)